MLGCLASIGVAAPPDYRRLQSWGLEYFLRNPCKQVSRKCAKSFDRIGSTGQSNLWLGQQGPTRLAALLSESDDKVQIRFMVLDKHGNLQPANPGSAENKAVRLLKEEWDR
jgi:hypothetical protein